MINLLSYNPFRILKVYTDEDGIASKASLLYLSTNNGITIFADYFHSLGLVQITPELIHLAEKYLETDSERVKYAMFWFMKGKDVEDKKDVAGGLLKLEEFERALIELEKTDSVSSRVNRSVIQLIKGNLEESVLLMYDVLSDSARQTEFLEMVCKGSISMPTEELLKVYLEALCENYPVAEVQRAITPIPELSAILEPILKEKSFRPAVDSVDQPQHNSECNDTQETGPTLCYFCGEPTNKKKSFHFEKVLERRSSDVDIHAVITKKLKKSVSIPTCHQCQEAMEIRDIWLHILGRFLSLAIFIGLYLAVYFHFYPDWSILMTFAIVILPGWIIAGIFGPILSALLTPLLIRIFDKKHSRQFKSIDDHPEVIQLRKDGFKEV